MQLLRELRLPQDSDFIQNNIGKTAPQIMAELLDHYRPGWNPADYDVHDLARRKNVFYLELAQKGLQPYPGVKEGLVWLKSQKIPMAVVSNGKRNELIKTMQTLDLFSFFDKVISRDDVSAFKPDPIPYLFGASSLGLTPDECIAVEDSPPGLEAALIARVPAVAVTTNFSRQILENPVPGRPDLKPHWIVPSMQEFFERLKACDSR
jgi:HAD superfamily hydrolase (TIGR01509 family)